MQMSLAGNITQDRWIRSQDPTAMVKSGMMMEIFILADTQRVRKQKESNTSWKMMAHLVSNKLLCENLALTLVVNTE